MKKIEAYIAQIKKYIIPEKLEDFKNFLYSVLKKEEPEYNDLSVKYAIQSMILLNVGLTPKEINQDIWNDAMHHHIKGAVGIISKYCIRGSEIREYFNSIVISKPWQLEQYNEKGLIFDPVELKEGIDYTANAIVY